MNDQQRIIDAHNEHFGGHTGSYGEPHYVVFFGDDLAGESMMIDRRWGGQDLGRDEAPVDQIYGRVDREQYQGREVWRCWSEPCLGLAFSYNRDFRWAYIGTEDSDEVHVERIGAEFPLAVFLAREDDYELTTVKDDTRFKSGIGELPT